MAWHRPARQITGMSVMVSRFGIVRFHGLYRARRRYGRGRFASLIPVGLAPDIPFTRPWAAMPPTATPPTGFPETNVYLREEDVKGDSAPVSCLRKFPIRPNERFAH